MKKVISVAAVVVMLAGANVVFADSFTAGSAFNEQGQIQDLGGVDLGSSGGITYISQEQAGIGGSIANSGSAAAEGQIQGENTGVTLTNSYATHSYDATAMTEGGSVVFGSGAAGHVEMQDVTGGIATVGNGIGTASVSGSTMDINQGTLTASAGIAAADAGAYADYNSSYEYLNAGTSSSIYQTGEQHSTMATVSGSSGNAGSAAILNANQTGGTAAYNSSDGTTMAGGGAAYGEIKTVNGLVTSPGSAAVAGSAGVQGQAHSYEQYSSNGAQTQWASGTVVTGNAVSDGI
jgi:hypothetical protein